MQMCSYEIIMCEGAAHTNTFDSDIKGIKTAFIAILDHNLTDRVESFGFNHSFAASCLLANAGRLP